MNEPRRSHRARLGAVGCLALALTCCVGYVIFPEALGFGSSAAAALMPLDVSGECSAAAVQAHFGGEKFADFQYVLTRRRAESDDIWVDYRDLNELRAPLKFLVASQVPECLESVLAEEEALTEWVVAAAHRVDPHVGMGFDDWMAIMWYSNVASAKWQRVKAARTKLVERTGAEID